MKTKRKNVRTEGRKKMKRRGPTKEGQKTSSPCLTIPAQDGAAEHIPTQAVPSSEDGPLVGVEAGDGPATEEQQKVVRKYEQLEEEVKNVLLSDNKNYFVIRNSMGIPEPDMLVWRECYIPLGPIKNDPRFTLRRPTDRKTGKPLVETHVPEFQYHIGKDIGMDEVLRLKTLYTELTDEGPGRPSNNKELVKFRARYGEGVRRQFESMTVVRSKVPEQPTSSDSEQVDTQKEKHRDGGPRAAEAQGLEEVKQAQAGTIFYKDDRYPLAAHLMTQLASRAIAAEEISTVAVALVLSRTKNLDSNLYNLLQRQATDPHAFAAFIAVELKEMFKSMDPTIMAQLDVMAMHLERWKEFALGLQYQSEQNAISKQKVIEMLTLRVDVAQRMMPNYLRIQYERAVDLMESNFVQEAEMTIKKTNANNEAVELAVVKSRNMDQNEGPAGASQDPPAGRPPVDRFERFRKLRETAAELRQVIESRPSQPVARSAGELVETSEPTHKITQQFNEWLNQNPDLKKAAEDLIRNFRLGNNPRGGSN